MQMTAHHLLPRLAERLHGHRDIDSFGSVGQLTRAVVRAKGNDRKVYARLGSLN